MVAVAEQGLHQVACHGRGRCAIQAMLLTVHCNGALELEAIWRQGLECVLEVADLCCV